MEEPLPFRRTRARLAVLRFLLGTDDACTASGIARSTGMNAATVSLSLVYLERCGWVRQAGDVWLPYRQGLTRRYVIEPVARPIVEAHLEEAEDG